MRGCGCGCMYVDTEENNGARTHAQTVINSNKQYYL